MTILRVGMYLFKYINVKFFFMKMLTNHHEKLIRFLLGGRGGGDNRNINNKYDLKLDFRIDMLMVQPYIICYRLLGRIFLSFAFIHIIYMIILNYILLFWIITLNLYGASEISRDHKT